MTPKPDAVAVRTPKALTFGAFHLTGDGLKVQGKAEIADFTSALSAVTYLESASPFWKADLLAYARQREDWAEALDSIIDAEHFTKGSVDEYVRVAKAIPPEARVEGVSFGHHQAVASLPHTQRLPLLKRAKREHLNVSELRREVRKTKARRIIKGQSGELAKLQAAIADHVHDAIEACREIMREDCKHAAKAIEKARHHLDGASVAVAKLKKAQGAK